MIDIKTIKIELKHLAMQAEQNPAPDIQKLLPAQMAALAAALGRKHGVKVEFGDFNTAATDGSTIRMPLTSKENSWIVRGFLDHETAHVRLTDFDQVPEGFPLRKTLWNVLEDVRIEGLMPLLYPGMATNYRALIRELRSQTPGLFEVGESDPPEVIIATYISLILRSLYLRQAELADLAINARQTFISIFGEDIEQNLLSLIMRVSCVKTTEGVLHLVDDIIELLGRHAAQPSQCPDQDKAQDGDSDGASGQVQDKGDSAADEDALDAESSTGGNVQAQTSNDGGQARGQDDGQAGADPSGADQASRQAAIKQALDSQDTIGDFGDQLRGLASEKEPTACSEIQIARPATHDELANAGYQRRPIKAPTQLVAQLSSKLRGLLQAEGLKYSKPGMSGSRIARQRLHRIKTGDPKLFLRRQPETTVNTALHILVDNSASMGEHRRFRVTREVALALVKALEPIRAVNLAVTVFPGLYPYPTRRGNWQIPVASVLPHSRRPGKTLLYPRHPEGLTPLDAVVRYAASTMLGLSEPRRIMLILTDGEPDNEETAEAAIKEAEDLGIEIICLGIEQVVCPRIFPRFEVVKSIDRLPTKVFNLLEQRLLLN